MEQENFLRGILKATPSSPGRPVSLLALFESNMSLDSLFVTTPSLARHPQEISHHTKTPEIGRKGSSNRLYRAIDTLRYEFHSFVHNIFSNRDAWATHWLVDSLIDYQLFNHDFDSFNERE